MNKENIVHAKYEQVQFKYEEEINERKLITNTA